MKVKNTPLCAAIALPLFLLIWVGASQVISHFPGYDDAYNATVAKNIATGHGYASSFDSWMPFNPEVTTGPTVILPGALLIDFFGSTYWVPAFTALILSLSLIFLICRVHIEYLEKDLIISGTQKTDWIYAVLILLLLVSLWISDISEIEFLGEFPAALFVCAGAQVIFLYSRNNVLVFLGGVLLGLSVTTKFVALNLVAPIVFVWAFVVLRDSASKNTLSKNIVCILILIIAISLPTLLFDCYKFFYLGPFQFYELKIREYTFFKDNGSGVSAIMSDQENLISLLLTNFTKNLQTLQDKVGGIYRMSVYAALFLAIIVAYIYKLFKKEKLSDLNHLALALVLAVAIYILWWLCMSWGWYRHLSPAVFVFSFAFVSAGCALLGKKTRPFVGVVLLIWIFVSPFRWSTLLNLPQVPKQEILEMQATSSYLSKLKAEGVTLLGCGWWANRRLEYFMPEPLNFRQCLSGDFQNSVLVIDRPLWNWENSEAIKNVENKCSQIIFENGPYQVFRCE